MLTRLLPLALGLPLLARIPHQLPTQYTPSPPWHTSWQASGAARCSTGHRGPASAPFATNSCTTTNLGRTGPKAGVATLPAGPAGDLERARALIEEESLEEAVEILTALVQRDGEDVEAHELLGTTLKRLGRDDVAAHHLDLARGMLLERGEEKRSKELLRGLLRADPHASSRRKLYARISDKALDAATKLAESGSPERALKMIAGVVDIAEGDERAEAEALFAELRAAYEKVDLDAEGAELGEDGAKVWPVYTHSSARYELECNLEPDVVHLVGETMDSIFDYYVSLYFDGDDSEISSQRATIRIHPNKDSMLENWSGGSAPEGWWSPGQRMVVAYDTRTSWGSLDSLLKTLFHEASHQFMTFMTKGGRSPAWLNEGTSSFFEGAVAMADNRVLWPDAALGRLSSLRFMLERGNGPTPRQVIEYMEPSSYPGEYYAFGWGFVYYLQQWEDPETLEYAYRPLYAQYRDVVTTKGGDSMKLFEEIFLGKKTPRGHETFEDFERDWKDWILNTVAPLHMSKPDERRELRMALVDRYLKAADTAADERKAPVPEAELLKRALLHLEYVRTQIDGEEGLHPELLLLQASILERLDYKRTAAPLLEQWLDLVDRGELEVAEELYDEVEKRLRGLDSKNYELRRIRRTMQGLAKSSIKLLAKYEKEKDPLPLRTYTFASDLARVFPGDLEIEAHARRLKQEAREAGVLLGVVTTLVAPQKSWKSIYSAKPRKFNVGEGEIQIQDLRPMGLVNTALELEGEYELRARISRKGKLFRGTVHGLIVGGTAQSDWLVVGLNRESEVGVWHVRFEGDGTTTDLERTWPLAKPPAADEDFDLAVHVLSPTKLEIRVAENAPLVLEVETRVPEKRNVGVFVKDGEMRLHDPVVEAYP